MKSKIFECTIEFDAKSLENDLTAYFGIGGEMQKAWDGIVLKGLSKYVPLDQGALIKSGTDNTFLGSGEIIYRAPYARRLYYNPQYMFGQDGGGYSNTGIRGGLWADRAERDEKEVWAAALEEVIKVGDI